MHSGGLVTESTARRLYAALAEEQASRRLPSVTAVLSRDGSLAWREACGEATGEPGLNPSDLQYRVGSITKTMTAVLVLQLRDEGALSLNDPVAEYVPEVGDLDVTLRSLLAHSSGLAAEPAGPWWERSAGRGFEDLLAALAEPAPFEPGRTYHYSNLGYGLLGEVVARLRGTSWWEVLSARLLEPLAMLRTSYDAFDPHAQGYSVHPWSGEVCAEPAVDTKAMAPAGQVWSTVLDLATFADFLVVGDERVLRASSIEEMATPQSGSLADGLGAGYGLGLRLVPGGSGVRVGHTGSMPGFQAGLFVDRARRTGVVVMANSTVGLRAERLAGRLLDLVEDAEPTVVAPWRPTTELPRQVAPVLGVWFWGNTALEATWDGTSLRLAPPDHSSAGSTFRLRDGVLVGESGYHHGEQLTLVRGQDGTAGHLTCSTFVLTRTPYDPSAPIPGGVPRPGERHRG
jgi:CubicO group peptidase (beta-lactamase class C family)